MTEKIIRYPLGWSPYYPTAIVTIDKSKEFKYSCSLVIVKGEESVMLCYCDNCHNKGHHIHFCYSEEEIEEPFNFKSIGYTVGYFKKHWESIMHRIENGR